MATRKAWTISATSSPAISPRAEVRYLIEHEWAQTADDVLWRRSKFGLTATDEEREALSRFMSLVRRRKGAAIRVLMVYRSLL